MHRQADEESRQVTMAGRDLRALGARREPGLHAASLVRAQLEIERRDRESDSFVVVAHPTIPSATRKTRRRSRARNISVRVAVSVRPSTSAISRPE